MPEPLQAAPSEAVLLPRPTPGTPADTWGRRVLAALRLASGHGTAGSVRAVAAMLAASLFSGAVALAAPAPEYGPEVEGAFLRGCMEDDGGRAARACRCMLERLQGVLGIERFHDVGEGGPRGLGASPDPAVRAASLGAGEACRRPGGMRDVAALP